MIGYVPNSSLTVPHARCQKTRVYDMLLVLALAAFQRTSLLTVVARTRSGTAETLPVQNAQLADQPCAKAYKVFIDLTWLCLLLLRGDAPLPYYINIYEWLHKPHDLKPQGILLHYAVITPSLRYITPA